MLNILINAYAVNPYWGSEQGMGWNWVINIARYCNVYVITEGEFKDNIEEAVMLLPQKIIFIFITIHFLTRLDKCVGIKGTGGFTGITGSGNRRLCR